jgi:hypothetical protein
LIDQWSLFSHLPTDDCHFGCKQKFQPKFPKKKETQNIVSKTSCDQKEGGRQNNQPDHLYGLNKVGFFEILKQTTTPDLFSHSSSQNIPVYIR